MFVCLSVCSYALHHHGLRRADDELRNSSGPTLLAAFGESCGRRCWRHLCFPRKKSLVAARRTRSEQTSSTRTEGHQFSIPRPHQRHHHHHHQRDDSFAPGQHQHQRQHVQHHDARDNHAEEAGSAIRRLLPAMTEDFNSKDGNNTAARDDGRGDVPEKAPPNEGHPQSLPGGEHHEAIAPVSYTHLTLPTIYSV